MIKSINGVLYKESKQAGICQSFTCQKASDGKDFLHQTFTLYGIFLV